MGRPPPLPGAASQHTGSSWASQHGAPSSWVLPAHFLSTLDELDGDLPAGVLVQGQLHKAECSAVQILDLWQAPDVGQASGRPVRWARACTFHRQGRANPPCRTFWYRGCPSSASARFPCIVHSIGTRS